MRAISTVLVLVALFAVPAAAAARLLAVLPFDVRDTSGKMDASARASLEDLLRDEAANALTSAGWTVLTGENTYALLRDNGIDPANCGEGECHVATARELKAEVFVSGVVHLVEGELVASVRIIETRTGRILVSDRLEGATTMALHRAFQKSAADFFARAGLLAPPPEAPSLPPPVAEATGDSYLFLRANPPETRITIDGIVAHFGKQGPYSAGTHVVRAEAEGYVAQEQKIDLAKGTFSRASFDLQPLQPLQPLQVAPVVPAPAASIASASPPRETRGENPPLPPQALIPPPKPIRPGIIWGSGLLAGAAAITAGSVVYDNELAPTARRNGLTAIDFVPVGLYLVAAGLGATGIYGVVAR